MAPPKKQPAPLDLSAGDVDSAVDLSAGDVDSAAPAKKPGFWDRYDKAVAPYTEIQKPDPKKPWSWSEASKAVGNIGAGGLGVILHPYETAKGTLETIGGLNPLVGAYEQHKGIKTVPQQMWESFKDNPLGTIEGAIGQAAAMGGAAEMVKGGIKLAPRVTGKLVHSVTGTGPDVAADLAKTTEKSNTVKEGKVNALNARRSEVDTARTAKTQAANDAALKEHEKTVAEADKKLRDAHVKHQAEKAEIENTNKAAAAIPDARAGLETHAKGLTEQADVRIEKARHDALAEGNEKYSTVNEQLNPLNSKERFLDNAVLDASEKIKGSDTSVPILNDMEKRIKTGDAVTYENLQGYYSELGREIVKGTLPGDVYKALDTLHESIGDEMQRIADSQGLGTELKSAREYWRRMKQTFGDTSDAISDRAGKELKDKNPDYVGGQISEYRQRLLGSFDPQIPTLLESAAKARERLGKLPSEESARKMMAEVPKAPEASEIPPPATKPLPAPRAPLPFERKTIGADDLTRANKESLAAREKKARIGYSPLLTSISVFDAIRNAMQGNWEAVGVDAAARGGYEIAKQGFAAALRNPKVIEFLSKPTAEQIAKIPPELRGPGLKPLLDAATKQGIKVDPRIYAATAALAPRKNPTDEWAGTSQ